jgi:hypothetical protein
MAQRFCQRFCQHCCQHLNRTGETMFPIPEQFSAATKAQFEAQFEAQSKIMHALTKQAFDSVERIIALNISNTKAALEKSSDMTHQLFAAQGSDKSAGARPAQPVLAAMLAHRDHVPSTEAAKPVAAEKPVAQPAVAKTVAAVKPDAIIAKAPVAKPAAAAKPVAKPVAVAKPVEAAKPVAVVPAKPVAAVKPAAATKPVAAVKPAAAPFVLPKKGDAPFPKSPVEK